MSNPDPECPFCDVPQNEIVAENELAYARVDKYPVSPGHTLLIPKRHTPSWFDATDAERAAIMALTDEAKARLEVEYGPDGYNIGINIGAAGGQTVMHLHMHLIPRFHGDVPDPRGGVRYVIPDKANYLVDKPPSALSTGGVRDPFDRRVAHHAARASQIDVVVAFAQRSGVAHLQPYLESAVERGAGVRILVSDYLNITQAQALRMLLDAAGGGARRRIRDLGAAAGAVEPHRRSPLRVRPQQRRPGPARPGEGSRSGSPPRGDGLCSAEDRRGHLAISGCWTLE